MKSFYTKYKTSLWVSFVISLLLSFFCYFFNNWDYPFRVDTLTYSLIEHHFPSSVSTIQEMDDVVFVNIAHDKMLIPAGRDGLGRIAITDRRKLSEFLAKLKADSINYKQIVLDIRFEYGGSGYDSSLTEQLLNTRDVTIAKHWDLANDCPFKLMDKRLNSIARYADFGSSISNSGFTKYSFLQEGERSIALEMYYKATKRDIHKFGWFYFDKWFCQNAPFLIFHSGIEDNSTLTYFDLGELLSDENLWFFFLQIADNSFLFIGDITENDIHDTYNGSMPGPIIHYQAFKKLLSKSHLINWDSIIIFVFYCLISFLILQQLYSTKTRWKFLLWVEGKPYLYFIITLLGFGFVLLLLSVFLYLKFEKAYNIFIPTLFFTLLNTTIRAINTYKKNKI